VAEIRFSRKACAVNPLKMSQPIGAALAFLGVDRTLPLLHGSQGCTAFGLVLFVRHFRETIPLQTTAMSEVTTILGGMDNIEQALVNIHKRAAPALIGLCSTGLTETRGDDVVGSLRLIREKHPELAGTEVVFVATPDYAGSLQEGWGKAVERMVETLVAPGATRALPRLNILPGSHLTPGDIEELREIVEAFSLVPVILPDLSGSLDGHIPETFLPHTLGGSTVDQIRGMGDACYTLAIGEQMRAAADALERRAGVPYRLLDRVTGLAAGDELFRFLADLSGHPVPKKYRRQRSQLQDAMLDGHFYFGAKRVAIGAEPDLLFDLGSFLAEMGCEIGPAVTTMPTPPLERLPWGEVLVGDLEDLEERAAGCDLLVTHSHGRQAAERLGIPLHRAGIPQFDRLGAAHRVSLGYRGTRELIFEIGNRMMERVHEAKPGDWKLPRTGSLDEAAQAGAGH
jgi:nitrogenase molybdenum-iron protein NifN